MNNKHMITNQQTGTRIDENRARHLSDSYPILADSPPGGFSFNQYLIVGHFLAAAPNAVPFSSAIAALTTIKDFADRPGRALNDAERLVIGRHQLQWLYTLHVPHG
jgi:hypothetical protein